MDEIKTVANCHKRTTSVLSVAALCLAASAVAAIAQDTHTYEPLAPEAGTDIPQVEVRMGVLPYADGSFPLIGDEMGFFEDVGIDIARTTVTEQQAHTLLMRGDLDVTHGYAPNFLPTYQNSRAVKAVMFHDVITAGCMLAAPHLNLTGIKDYMGRGMAFDQAIAEAMAPVQGNQLASTPVPNERLFEQTISDLSGVTWVPQIMEDSNILVAARAGQIEFAHPSGAPVVYSLLQEGWTRLVCLDDLIEHGPSGPDSPVLRSISLVGAESNADWIGENQHTLLRYLSAVWRTVDAVTQDPSLYDIQAPILNSITGTDLTGEDLANTVELFHPYIPYEENGQFYNDQDSLLYYKPLYEQIIGGFVENGVVPDDVSADEFVWGHDIWMQLEEYRMQTDELLAALDGTDLSAEQGSLVDEAKKHYGWHNYLDAYRFARAASE